MSSPLQFDRVWDSGKVDLILGFAQVANPNVTANTMVFMSAEFGGGAQGLLRYVMTPGVGFNIVSGSNTDTSHISYCLMERLS
jgi:hypothetical protein